MRGGGAGTEAGAAPVEVSVAAEGGAAPVLAVRAPTVPVPPALADDPGAVAPCADVPEPGCPVAEGLGGGETSPWPHARVAGNAAMIADKSVAVTNEAPA